MAEILPTRVRQLFAIIVCMFLNMQCSHISPQTTSAAAEQEATDFCPSPRPNVQGLVIPSISAIRNDYANIYATGKQYNSDNPQMDRWMMNCEHCLLTGWTDEKLYEEVIAFVRRPGGLDFMFSHLLDDNLSDTEILVDAEILIYAGEYRKTYDEVINVGKRAKEVLSAAESGRFLSAEKRFPNAPIREKIENAARRSIARGRGDFDAVSSTQRGN